MWFKNAYDVLCYVFVVLHDFYAEITEASLDTMVCKMIWFLTHTEFKCRRLLFLLIFKLIFIYVYQLNLNIFFNSKISACDTDILQKSITSPARYINTTFFSLKNNEQIWWQTFVFHKIYVSRYKIGYVANCTEGSPNRPVLHVALIVFFGKNVIYMRHTNLDVSFDYYMHSYFTDGQYFNCCLIYTLFWLPVL